MLNIKNCKEVCVNIKSSGLDKYLVDKRPILQYHILYRLEERQLDPRPWNR